MPRLRLLMKTALQHSLLTWAMIAAQLIVVLGHGRVVVCHDDNGSTHIELIGETASTPGSDDLCGLTLGGALSSEPSACSDLPCEDELFGLTYTVSTTRRANHMPATVPACPPTIATSSTGEGSTGVLARAAAPCEVLSLRAQRKSLRATVLLL